MDFLSIAKGLIFEDKQKSSTVSHQTKADIQPQIQLQQSSDINQEMIDHVNQVAQKRNTSYSAFLSAETSLVDIIPDIQTRLKAAAKVTVNDSRSAQKIIDDIALHINDVESDLISAIQSFKLNQKQTSDLISQNILSIEKTNSDKQNQINQLTETIKKLSSDITLSSVNLEPMKNELQTKKDHFDNIQKQYESVSNSVKQKLLDRKLIITSTII